MVAFIGSLVIVLLVFSAAIATFKQHRIAPIILALLAIERLTQIGVEAVAGASSTERWFDVTFLALFVFGGVYVYLRTGREQTSDA